jgi:hypothetical protein
VANMTDQARVNWILSAFFTASATATFTPGTGGGSALVITPPYKLRLMQTMSGSNVTPNAELAGGSGYTTGGNSLGTTFCASAASGQQSNSNLVSWTATGTWATVTGIEIWDSAASPLRWLQGSITSITGVVNGDTVSFAAAAITLNASQW